MAASAEGGRARENRGGSAHAQHSEAEVSTASVKFVPVLDERQRAELGKLIVSGPLYRPLRIEHLLSHGILLENIAPETVRRLCDDCGHETAWQKNAAAPVTPIGGFGGLTYACRNCTRQTFFVWLGWFKLPRSGAEFVKVGQWPRFELNPAGSITRALGGRIGLYRSGLTLRHHGFGIGAVTYFRRLVEETTDELLDLLAAAMRDVGVDPGAVERVINAKGLKVFDEKVKIAADVLPPSLRPGGMNPFGLLHGLLSKGIHKLDDEECCGIVDMMDQALTLLYTQLKAHAEDQKALTTSLKALQQKHHAVLTQEAKQ